MLLIDKFHFVTLYLRPVQVSTVYNRAIATSNTEIIANSVIVLFVMDLDEYVFASLKACNRKWIAHASDSESSAAKESAIEEMKEQIALQKTQIASQQEELATQQEDLKLQKEQAARQSNEIAILRKAVQKMQDSFVQSIPQIPLNVKERVTAHTAELEGASSERDVEMDDSVNEVECLNQVPKDVTCASDEGTSHREEEIGIPCMKNEVVEEPQSK